jgi:hypothetical protein
MSDRADGGRAVYRIAVVTGLVVLLAALAARAWAASLVTFPRPEDTAYYVGVARNLIEGRGLVSDAIWSYATPPLVFPRPAFEVWLPLPTFLAAAVMALLGPTFAAAQWSSVLVGALVPVLAWRLAADLAVERGLPVGRARVVSLGAGLTAVVSLPLVLHSVQPDSTMPFAALALAGCRLMAGIVRDPRGARARDPRVLALGLVLGLAAWTRNEAVWLALTWVIVARSTMPGDRRAWLRLVGGAAVVAMLVFVPWAIRDWLTFGSPLPGQALANALSLTGLDIFAWSDPPTLGRYLAAGPATLLALRWTGLVHNVVNVLLLLGMPTSAVGLVALPWLRRARVVRPLVVFAALTFSFTTLVFPVSTTWGTFLHAAGPIHVLLILSAVFGLDRVIAAVGTRRGWTRPVAWLGPTLMVVGGLLITAVLLPRDAAEGRALAARYEALPAALAEAGVPLQAHGAPVITRFPIWLSEAAGVETLALPDEPPAAVVDLARRFPGTGLLVLNVDDEGRWPEVLAVGGPGSECFHAVALTGPAVAPGGPLADVRVFRIDCP